MKPGDHVVLVAFGAGLTWASAVVHWAPPVIQSQGGWRKQLQSLRRFGLAPAKSLRQRAGRKVDALLPNGNGDENGHEPPAKTKLAVPQPAHQEEP